jgi:hypothetical protein
MKNKGLIQNENGRCSIECHDHTEDESESSYINRKGLSERESHNKNLGKE